LLLLTNLVSSAAIRKGKEKKGETRFSNVGRKSLIEKKKEKPPPVLFGTI